MRLSLFFFILLFACVFVNCSSKSQEEKEIEKLRKLGFLYIINQSSSWEYDCNSAPSPKTFSEFTSAIDSFNTSVYKCTECHGVNTAQANFIITNYSSVIQRVNASSPNTSVLYFKVKPGGAMSLYSNAQVNKAIYCWIANGALQ